MYLARHSTEASEVVCREIRSSVSSIGGITGCGFREDFDVNDTWGCWICRQDKVTTKGICYNVNVTWCRLVSPV